MSRAYYFFQFADNPTTRQPGKFSASILPSVPQLMNFAVNKAVIPVNECSINVTCDDAMSVRRKIIY